MNNMINATEKLFYKDPYLCQADCEVEDVIEKDGKYEVILKSTPFYPEGGGQPSDIGYMDNIKVEYVYEKDEVIYHVMSEKPRNKIVHCEADLERRIDHNQQHSGEHLMSAAFFKLYNGVNAGFHLGEDYVTLDIKIKDMTEDMIKKAEMEANYYVFKNEPVKTYFVTKEEAEKLPLRKAITAEGKIRMVQMGENLDYSACCGTQVRRTGEIRIIKIVKWEKNKGMTRIYIKCGLRAFKDYITKNDYVTEIARGFSVEDSEIINKVKSQTDEIGNLKKKISTLYSTIAENEAEQLMENSKDKYIIKEYKEEGFDFLDKLYEHLKNEEYILILTSLKDNRLLFAHNGSFAIECGKLFKEKLKEFGGRGGGNAKRAQANFQDTDSMRSFTEYLKENALN
ncbi:alanyl-tRNA editing protein [Clostridium pasteurianum]|uniref:alanyl-tRNA editing protein n=1 Tax=Clostridium pasteurianum TaxID=1501 RepID=UPI002260FAC6|nr:alanyl-tRNA editing protein [Clostridium pasteurianum]UZW12499.1 alanyl-tRNA editing protein [Clostridium pasteurianum]